MATKRLYATTIRDVLGHVCGRSIIDITQQDPEDYAENGQAYVQLMLDDGSYLIFYIGDEGFTWGHPELWDTVDGSDPDPD